MNDDDSQGDVMPIEVISEKPERYNEVVCPKCRFRLKYTPADVQSFKHTDYSGSTDNVYYIECPREQCRERIELSPEQSL